MIVFPGMLAVAAEKAGMPVPTLSGEFDSFDKKAYPHFHVFCEAQLGRPMQPGEHWENAKVIAAFSVEEIRQATPEDLRRKGFSGI